MSLEAGSTLGPYEVLASIGAGGMGEVYRARDVRLARTVAIKVLPGRLAGDEERRLRFEREAQLLAALNHPCIASIYGTEESHGALALVMEYAEGVTLAERIAQGPIPVDETLDIARHVAEALEYAHEKGVIHRDLKPANVKLSPEGHVKVLDFGLAKALADTPLSSTDIAHSPTLTAAATKAGMILGTAAYMSPEQARGKGVDRRADIWSFGCLLYEMLSGAKAFPGDQVADVLAGVMRGEPDWNGLPGATPRAVRELLRRCLAKDVRQRLQAIGDARIVLEEAANAPEELREPRPAATGVARKTSWRWPAAIAAIAVLAIAAGLLLPALRPAPESGPLRKFVFAIPGLRVGITTPPAIAPDGNKIAYATQDSLWVRELDRLEPKRLTGGLPEYFFWSPDSNWLAYLADGKLWKVHIRDAQPSVIARAVFPRGGTTPGGVWTSDGRIVFAQASNGTGMLSVSAAGGDFTEFLARDVKTESDFHKPSALPAGKGLLFISDRNETGPDSIALLAGSSRKTVLQLKRELLDSPVYSPTGHILYHRGTGSPGIWALPFSLEKLEGGGEPFLVAAGARWPAVSTDGTLLYSDGTDNELELALLSRNGPAENLGGQRGQFIRQPRFSPDGTRVAASGQDGIFIYDLRRKTRTRLTFDESLNTHPVWSAKGDAILYGSRKGGGTPSIFRLPADGSGERQLVVEGIEPTVSLDGKWLAFAAAIPGEGFDLFYTALEGERKPVRFLQAPGHQARPSLSPDGRHMAFESDESGRYEVYVKPFPSGEGKWQVSTSGGAVPRWNRAGTRLYYVQDATLMEVEVDRQRGFSLGNARPVFPVPQSRVRWAVWYDVSPDGDKFVVAREAETEAGKAPSLILVQNWFAEFRERGKK